MIVGPMSPSELVGPQLGQLVRVRQRRYLVEGVAAGDVPHEATLVTASCVDDDARGQTIRVLWEHEADAEILNGEAWKDLAKKGFDPASTFSAYLHTLRWNCVTATDPKLFQAPFRAGIRIDAYQLEPLRKALLLPRVNLFIADDVGLGKTIEAGLIARELLMRRKVETIVVAAPPSMLPQWQEELDTRFGLTFEILDREYVAQVRRERGYGINPWTTHSRFLVSHKLLIDETYHGPLRAWLGELKPGSLLILDEAHHAAPSSGAKYAIDSDITRAIRDLAPRFEHRLFLSATPHNGHSNSFSALLELLDPQRFVRGVPIRGKRMLDDVMVRRLKEDLRNLTGGFPERKIDQVDIDGLPKDSPELLLPELLDRYRELREERMKGATKRQQASAGLLVSGLQQRLLSSIEAFARTLRVHRKTVERLAEKGGVPMLPFPPSLPLVNESLDADDERAELPEEKVEAEADAQIETATESTFGELSGAEPARLFREEQLLLERMTEIAENARSRPDGKVLKLIEWIRQNMCTGLPARGSRQTPGSPPPRWNDLRLLIFTEWDDTRRYLVDQLRIAIESSDQAEERIAVFHGPTPKATREEIKAAFNSDLSKHPLRILVATDAAREGLNLQTHCWNLFHFDLPWNPSRLEQRNGRIDRKLQPAPKVFCRYFVYTQRPEDRVLQALVRKTETIKKELGSLASVVDAKLSATLRQGIRRRDLDEQERLIDAVDIDQEQKKTIEEELEDTRERREALAKQIETLGTQLEHSREQIGLDENHFRAAISSSLEMLGAQALSEEKGSGSGPLRWRLPELDQRKGADPTWIDTLDTLRVPRRRDQKPWEWRREAPIRPVIFEDPGTMDSGAVHLHLEHRVVQRLLGRFTAQGFVHHDLSRACLAQTKDAIPRVALLARLALYGPGAARLHEEILPITARWIDPAQRRARLEPFKREAEAKTMQLIEDSLAEQAGRPLEDVVQKRLLAAAQRDVEELLTHLEARGRECSSAAAALLVKRGEAESRSMREILESQKRRILEAQTKSVDPTPSMFPDEHERRQVDADHKSWVRRLAALERELATEPERIRAQYEVVAERLEPIGLLYLWPVSG
jgi:hypothetical protein